MYKVIVTHPHQQHSYHLAGALEKKGILFKYITTVYNKPGSFTKKIIPFLKGDLKQRAVNRQTSDISNENVLQICELWGLFILLAMRLTQNDKRIMNPLNDFVSKIFQKKVAHYAIKNNVDMVISYDNESSVLFSKLKKSDKNIIRVLDMSAANKLFLKEVYENDFKECPEFSERLKKERVDLFSKNSNKTIKASESEIKNANYFLVPSNFVSESLYYSGIKKNQILYCQYGVDLKNFPYQKKKNYCYPLNFVYVGGIKQLKGIGYLLKAFHNIPKNKARLTVVGAINRNDKDILPYINDFESTGHIIHSKVPNILAEKDIFIFPSLGDSFSLSALEAASCGLPLIVSKNTGMIDGMKNGKEGFIIDVQNTDEIIQKVNYFIDNLDKISRMGAAASEMAKEFTWENYDERVFNQLIKLLENKNNF